MSSGIIFDIQRFSLHDGPGIRTTVFFKGCPLTCIWCCNPESQRSQPQLGFVAKNCQHCMHCVQVCSTEAHLNKNGRHEINFERCRSCGTCIEACPHGALRLHGETMSVQQVLQIIEKDRAYYNASGGGVTISGGEPFGQFDFLISLLQACHQAGIHTCVETSGFTAPEKLSAAAKFIDYILFDYKASDEQKHKQLTGVSNKLVLENLELLSKMGNKTRLRCPLIPGLNDDSHHLWTIVNLSRRFHNIDTVEIMPYHAYGRSKAAEIGQSYALDIPAAPTEQIDEWKQELVDLGCKKLMGTTSRAIKIRIDTSQLKSCEFGYKENE